MRKKSRTLSILDLFPQGIMRVWALTRKALMLCTAAMVIGMTTVGTGRTIQPVINPVHSQLSAQPVAAVQSISKPVAPTEELIHDAIPEPAHTPGKHVIWMEVTAYCACPKCCGPNAQGITASGKLIDYNNGKFVAADTSVLPFGTRLMIPGYDSAPVEVIDRGGAIKGNKLDVFFATHEQALQWGRQWIAVTVVD